ncbi:Aldehyde dehydrogenase [Kalmanozyma brasiliensis GHG001]|uniref:glutamate-5-semialdehyde dehydrogenase n=1 Tax=Kalmanozyma brasiliensis (strain GHG001) TaxID=1365824 RepID=V5ES53_KALBG|nr:Aldehyde dehydrogenase [Kalmanozyma brasiliensis GHG001]EST05768.1 Aldehyde dehydrogenase [Kalmanozyma brasiliensis GHG001]
MSDLTTGASSAETVARQARTAFEHSSQLLSSSSSADATRSSALLSIRTALESNKARIVEANKLDMEAALVLVEQGKLSSSLAARLDLFSKAGKWESLLAGVSDVAALPSPLDHVQWAKRLADETATQGAVDLYRITCPIGVLLCIFEARPEVVVNIASLAIKSGNAAILKGGKESKHTAAVLSGIIAEALEVAGLPKGLIQTVETREDIQSLLHLEEFIDLVIPRGSNELVKAIQREARMPVMGHADGLCIGYVHSDAELEMVKGTVVDSKTDYPAACNALETLLVHESLLGKADFWPPLAQTLLEAGIELRLDEASLSALPQKLTSRFEEKVKRAQPQDFHTEFLDLTLAIASIASLDAAIKHITTHSSGHTDLILTSTHTPNPAAERFVKSINSANVFVNVSTRFADGFRFGLGTEVGISTGKTHARGPVGLDGLVIYKYVAKSVGGGKGAQTAGEFNKGRKWAHREIEAVYPEL